MDFVDLQGASGRSYRFRRWPPGGQHLPIAGNYALVRICDRHVVALGIMENLSDATADLTRIRDGLEFFTRFNVARTHREAEHTDLWAALPRSQSSLA